MRLAQLCYEITARFSGAVSTPPKIAEGHSRRSRPAFLNHLSIACASQAESETPIELSERLTTLSKTEAEQMTVLSGQRGRMLNALMRSVESKAAAQG